MSQAAIGLIETRGLVGLIEAADAATKAAGVELLGFEQVGGGLVSIRFSGDVASVQTAVQAGVEAARQLSEVISHHVIPAPHADLVDLLEISNSPVSDSFFARPADPIALPSLAELENLPVAQLRQLVRQTPGASLKGRQVSRANKRTLIAELRQTRQEES